MTEGCGIQQRLLKTDSPSCMQHFAERFFAVCNPGEDGAGTAPRELHSCPGRVRLPRSASVGPSVGLRQAQGTSHARFIVPPDGSSLSSDGLSVAVYLPGRVQEVAGVGDVSRRASSDSEGGLEAETHPHPQGDI